MSGKRVKFWFALAVLGVAAALISHRLMRPHVLATRAERLMREYGEHPSIEMAQQLGDMLCFDRVPPEVGNRIVHLLFDQTVHVREAYVAGKPIHVGCDQATPAQPISSAKMRELQLVGLAGQSDRTLTFGTQSSPLQQESVSYYLGNGQAREPLRLPTLLNEPGEYEAQVEVVVKLWPLRGKRERILTRPPKRWWIIGILVTAVRSGTVDPGPPLYSARIVKTFTFRVLPSDAPLPLDLRSSPELDAQMRQGIALVPTTSPFPISWRRCVCNSMLRVDIEENAVFRGTFVDDSGTQRPLKGPIIVRAGRANVNLEELLSSGKFADGNYAGTLILDPDCDAAWTQPDIKSMWNGKLQLPLTFTIKTPQLPADIPDDPPR